MWRSVHRLIVCCLMSSGLTATACASGAAGTHRGAASTRAGAADLDSARTARDRGDVPALRTAIAGAEREAARTGSFAAALRLAVLQSWMCEAAEARGDRALIRRAAQAGIAAAETAVRLNTTSSSAHQVLADLLSLLIPHVFGGGMRYGRRSTEEADRAIALDRRNPDAYVTRAIIYLYTPAAFGGSKSQALSLLKKAVELDPKADTPRVWLARAYAAAGQTDQALREASHARRLNPDRLLVRAVHEDVLATARQAGAHGQPERQENRR